jgi:hypothetical protein
MREAPIATIALPHPSPYPGTTRLFIPVHWATFSLGWPSLRKRRTARRLRARARSALCLSLGLRPAKPANSLRTHLASGSPRAFPGAAGEGREGP